MLFVHRGDAMGAQWLAPSLTELLTERPAKLANLGSTARLLVRVGPSSGRTLADVQSETEVLHLSAGPDPVDLSALTGHRRLRTLITESSAVVSLAAVAGLPALNPRLRLDRWPGPSR